MASSLTRKLTFCSALLSLVFSVQANAIMLGQAGDFNTFVLGSFNGSNSSTAGRLAVGGSANITSYSIGRDTASPGPADLVVGGSLSAGNASVSGSAEVGGASGAPSWFARDGLVSNTPTSVDFNAAGTYLRNLSTDLSALTDTGSWINSYGTLNFTGDSVSDLQVFSLDASDLSSASNLLVDGLADGATLLFNISGELAGISNMGLWDLESLRDRVLFNFYEATALDISNVSIQGSILAPNALITSRNASIYGTTVAGSWDGSASQYNVAFSESSMPSREAQAAPSEVAAPGSLALMALSLFLIARARKRRQLAATTANPQPAL